MKNDDFILLLQIIRKNGNVENLRKYGYQYSQIANLINYVITEGYCEYSNDGMSLTKEGENVLALFNKRMNRKNSESLISPQKEYKSVKEGNIYDVYLPDKIKNLK